MKTIPVAACLTAFALPLSVPMISHAEDATPTLYEGEHCIPLSDVTGMAKKMTSLKPSKRDTVALDLTVGLKLEDGESLPEQIELRTDDVAEALVLDDKLYVRDLTPKMTTETPPDALCFVDPVRTGRTREEMGYSLKIGMRVGFIDTPGTHSMAQIEDGLKDGRSHYKKMAGAFAMMVPKFDHIVISGDDRDNPPTVFATKAGADIGEPTFELYDGARMIDVDVLEEMGADGVRVVGEYRLSPGPDAETMAKFSGD